MKGKKAVFILILLLWNFAGEAQHFNRYCNSVVPFCLDLPGNLNRTGTSPHGDGHQFAAKDSSTLFVYATFNTEKESLQQRLDREQATLAADTTIANFTQMPASGLAQTQENSYTLSFQNANFSYLFFRKLENDNWINLELKYPTTKAKEYDEKIKRMLGSLN